MPRPDAREQITRYNEAKNIRAPYENDWRMASAYVMPRHYSAWQTNGPATLYGGNEAARRFAFDSAGVRSLPKYVSILHRLCTPDGMRYQKLKADDPHLMKIYRVRVFFEQLTDLIFKMRAAPRAGAVRAQGEVYGSIGVYGIGPEYVAWRKRSAIDPKGGFGYRAQHLRDLFILVDDDGNVDTIFRRFWLNARQFRQKFPNEKAPPCLEAELKKPTPSETAYFEFVHIVHPRNDFDPGALNTRRFPLTASYISVQDATYVGEEEGYRTMPYLTPRVLTEADDIYGYSPAMQALPALGSLNAMKKTILKAGHKAVDPVLLAHDDGVLSGKMDLRPGHVNYGAIGSKGEKLVQTLEMGNLNVGEKLMEGERTDIEDSFFVTLFTLLTERPEMTATQVLEETAQRASLLAPAMGRLQSEYLGPRTDREINLLAEQGFLVFNKAPASRNVLEVPPELIEAQGEYSIEYTSPMARGLHADEVAGFWRLSEQLTNAAAAAQDPSLLDWLDMDAAIPDIAEYQSVRTSWVTSPDKVAQIREGREGQQQQQQLLEQAPALASVAKAAMDKNLA